MNNEDLFPRLRLSVQLLLIVLFQIPLVYYVADIFRFGIVRPPGVLAAASGICCLMVALLLLLASMSNRTLGWILKSPVSSKPDRKLLRRYAMYSLITGVFVLVLAPFMR